MSLYIFKIIKKWENTPRVFGTGHALLHGKITVNTQFQVKLSEISS